MLDYLSLRMKHTASSREVSAYFKCWLIGFTAVMPFIPCPWSLSLTNALGECRRDASHTRRVSPFATKPLHFCAIF